MAVVYKHVRLDTGEVFYVGIGKSRKRAYSSSDRNKLWKNITSKTVYDVIIVQENISWEEACTQEKELINKHGRRDLGLGTLVNMTDGGDGAFNPTREVRERLRQAKMGKSYNKGVKRGDLSARNKNNKGRIPWNKGLKNPAKSVSQLGNKNHRYGKTGIDNTESKPCSIEGVEYDSAATAARVLNINYYTLTKRLTSQSAKYSTWIYLK